MATNLNVTGILTVDSDATIKGSMKLDSLTSSSILILDTNKNVTVSNVTSTELGYLKGVTSSIQTQLNNKPGEIVVTGTSKGEIFNDYTYNVASANYAHAEGSGARASGGCSHAEGEATNASGYASHAEGQGTRATGGYSHTEGNNTAASGNASHAEGFGTKASSTSQHVQGKYNVEDTDGIYAHIVGWGSNDLNRKNIHTIDTSGNAMFTGKITVLQRNILMTIPVVVE